jgi:hypothetical protein
VSFWSFKIAQRSGVVLYDLRSQATVPRMIGAVRGTAMLELYQSIVGGNIAD